MSTQTHGFDSVYLIDRASLLASLDRVLTYNIQLALRTLNLSIPINGLELAGTPLAPANTLQQGLLQTTSQPTETLTMPTTINGNLTLELTFPGTLLSLNAVPAVVGINLFAGLRALAPSNAGNLRITIIISLNSTPATNRIEIVLARQSLTVDSLSAMPALNLSPTNAINVANYATGINDAVRAAVNAALGPLMPVRINIPFGDRGACDVGVRQLATRLLPAGNGTQAALGFFATLRDGSAGNINQATVSTLPANAEGSFALANQFLLNLVCCLIQQHVSIKGLGSPTSGDANCCRWQGINNVSFSGQTVRLEEMRICIERSGSTARFTVFAHASRSGWGWSAHGTVSFAITIQRSGNGILATPVDVVPNDWVEKEWWVWLIEGIFVALGIVIGAVVGFIVGGPAGAIGGGIAGGAIALAIVAVGELIMWTMMGLAAGAVSGALSTVNAAGVKLLPQELTETFGGLSEILAVDFDDLRVAGRMRRAQVRILREAWEVILYPGDRLDLDRGVVIRVGEPEPEAELDADLIWSTEPLAPEAVIERPSSEDLLNSRLAPGNIVRSGSSGLIGEGLGDLTVFTARSLATVSGARMVKLTNMSYWSLTESDARQASYSVSGQRVPDTAIPASNVPYPAGAAVLLIRTTAGRYAKCAAWRAGSSLHIGFITYDTPLPFLFRQRWSTTQGPQVPSSGPFTRTYQVARSGRIDAEIAGWWLPTFSAPVEWFWEGVPIEGSGMLPNGTTSYSVFGRICTLRTAMGSPLSGTLQARLVLPYATYVATAELNLAGTVTYRDVPMARLEETASVLRALPEAPFIPTPSLAEQLPAAIAKGMRIPIDQVKLR